MNRSHYPMFLLVILASWLGAVSPAKAQLRSSQGVLGQWSVKQRGPTSTARKDMVLSAESVDTFPDNRMRWYFSIINRGTREVITFKFNESFVADKNGLKFTQRGRQFPGDTVKIGIRHGISFFWIDFENPKAPTETFVIHIATSDEVSGAVDEFKEFTVRLGVDQVERGQAHRIGEQPATSRAVVNQDGATSDARPNLVLGVSDVAFFPDGRMRWTFYINHKSYERFVRTSILNRDCYIADMKGIKFTPQDVEYKQQLGGFPLAPNSTFRFWIDFDLPKDETTEFKVKVFAFDDLKKIRDEFKEFVIKLDSTAKLGVPVVAPEERVNPDPPVGKPDAGAVEEKAPTKPTNEDGRVGPNRAKVPVTTPALFEFGARGSKFEGNIKAGPGLNYKCVILFHQHEGDSVSADLTIKSPTPRDVPLTGAFVEDMTVNGERALKLKDRQGGLYRFVPDGRMLTGKDSQGCVYTMFPAK
jgi:hypothetical protein